MRKIIVSMNVTLDGFMAGPSGELDWHFSYWNKEMAAALTGHLAKADTILLGRKTYEAMAQYWPLRLADPSYARQDIPFAEMVNAYRKIVFSKSLTAVKWNNSVLLKGNIKKEVRQLKKQQGKNIMIYGSGSIASAIIRSGLADECHIWVHPVVLGKGKPLFKDLKNTLTLKLFNTRIFSSGVVVFFYTDPVL